MKITNNQKEPTKEITDTVDNIGDFSINKNTYNNSDENMENLNKKVETQGNDTSKNLSPINISKKAEDITIKKPEVDIKDDGTDTHAIKAEKKRKAINRTLAEKSKIEVSVDDKHVKNERTKKKRNLWWLKIGVISLFLSAFISFISEMTASTEQIIVTVMLLMFLILASILFDGIGVAATSCDITPIRSMASKKIYGAKTALWLVKNNEKVSNVCNDVIGDIFGIISGACTAAIVVKIVAVTDIAWQRWLTILISSIVAALTIGGKAFLKDIAISNSKEFIMFVARIIAIFSPEERKRKKNAEIKRKKRQAEIEKSKLNENGTFETSNVDGKDKNEGKRIKTSEYTKTDTTQKNNHK